MSYLTDMCIEDFHDSILSMFDGNGIDYVVLSKYLIHLSIISDSKEVKCLIGLKKSIHLRDKIINELNKIGISYNFSMCGVSTGISVVYFTYMGEQHSINLLGYFKPHDQPVHYSHFTSISASMPTLIGVKCNQLITYE